ncbi:hypothetical protein [Oceanobacter mangrovi]|uniref:hypothetical protein n=1 Tax=Oceanobacter mangrovi TaxID=2862510 RepID=UPI001C8DFC41|nr:hypothetical protein [Oceanobacter mangrovi]
MLSFFIAGLVVTVGLSIASYMLLQRRVLDEVLRLDDAKGYLLVIAVLIAFLVSAVCFYFGQVMGYDQAEETSTLMALAILLDVTSSLICLIVGLQRMREPEHY